jgi:putative RNA 2'-phosphotransferase
VLGRQPEEFGLIPDAEGFVKVKDFLKALHEEEGWGYVNLTHLNEVMLSVPEPPFEMAAGRIRARSRPAPSAPPASGDPPKLLYAAIRRRAYRWVLENGLQPAAHPEVVLCASREMAERMGRRIDAEPILLTILVQACRERGIIFRPAGEGLFLAPEVPVGCFSGPAPPREAENEKKAPKPEPKSRRSETAGSFLLELDSADQAHVPKSLRGRDPKGRRQPKRGKQWTRDQPPWRK